MVDLNKLNKMLDDVLNSETSESLNSWIDTQLALDRVNGITHDDEFEVQNEGIPKKKRISSVGSRSLRT